MAGSNNFTVHNPTNANQETDGTFAGDSLTTSGIGTDATLPSPWLNARWYEDSVGFYALAQMMAAKGYVMNKDNPIALAGVLANLLTNADVKPPLITVGYSPTPAFNAALANGFDFTLAGNVISSTLVGAAIGQIITFVITQGATPYTFVPPSNVNGWVPINSTPNSTTVLQFIVKEDGTIWDIDIPSAPLGSVLVSNGTNFIPRIYTRSASLFGGIRNLGGTYTNTSVAEMDVAVTCYITGTYGEGFQIAGYINGAIDTVAGTSNDAGWRTVKLKVPQGATYSVAEYSNNVSNPQTPIPFSWYEGTYV